MNKTKEKIELAKLVLELEDPAIIEKIHKLVTQESSEFWLKLTPREKKKLNWE